MKKLYCSTLSIFLLGAFLLGACSAKPATTATAVPAAGTPVPTHPSGPTDTAVPAATATATSAPAPEPFPCTIAFDSDRDGNREVYSMDSEGEHLANLTLNDGDDFNPAWSPDGEQIAFVSNRVTESEGGQFVYIMNADGSDVRQLTLENDSDFPDWSPDGRAIAYSAYGDIYIIPADGSQESLNLTNSPEQDWKAVWSMDGSQIAWLSGADNNWNVFVMNADGSHILQLTDNGTATDVEWTVQNQLFMHYDGPDGLCFNCLIDRDGSNMRDAGGKGSIQEYIPYWTLDGDRVELVSGNVLTSDEEILLVGEIYPDIFKNLTNNPANDVNPDWPLNCGPYYGAAGLAEEAVQESSAQASSVQGGGEIVIGYTGQRSPLEESDLQTACSELNVQCVEGSDIAALVDQNVAAIVYFSNRWNVMGDWPMIYDADMKGVPLIVLNAESNVTNEPGVYNLSIDSDSTAKILDWMLAGMGGTGEFIYYNVGGSSSHQELIDQALEAYAGVTGLSVPANYDGEALREENIVALLEQHPEAGAVWADEFVPNIFWAVTGMQTEPLPRMLCEAKMEMLTAWKDKLDNNIPVQCITAVRPGGTGYEGVYVAYYLASDETIDPQALGGMYGNTLIYDYPLITNDNLSDWIEKSVDFRMVDGGSLQLAPLTPDEIRERWFME